MKQLLGKVLSRIRIVMRLKRAYQFSGFRFKKIVKWSFQHTEYSNYYYQITPRNLAHINSTLAFLTNSSFSDIQNYSDEIVNNIDLKANFNDFINKNKGLRDSRIEIGRRVFWYSLIRATKPRVVVETGISHGVGSCVIAAALLMNSEEGFSGKAFGTEIDHTCGSLLCEPWNDFYEILFGDSIQTLIKFNESVDIFISDSDHSPTYEYDEYKVINSKLSKNGILLADNAHASDSLIKFSIENDRNFLFVQEKPHDHWYPGAGVGISIKGTSIGKFQD